MAVSIKRMERREAEIVSCWKYDEPYGIYSMDGGDECIREMLEGTYYAVLDEEGDPVGYYCYGSPARVPAGYASGAYEGEDALDIGLGMRPDLCGKGGGLEFFNRGLAFAREEFQARKFRLTVAAFNKRAAAVYERAGFRRKKEFARVTQDSEMKFITMVTEAAHGEISGV